MAKAFDIDTGGTLQTNLVAWYNLEDVNDEYGSRTLTNTGTVTFDTGKINNAANFGDPNTTKYLSRTSDDYGIQGGTMSMSAWIYLSSESARPEMGIISQENNDATARVFYQMSYLTASNVIRYVRTRTGVEEKGVSSSAISTGTWYHVVITYNGTTLEGFLNNSSVGTIAASGTAGNDELRSDQVRIGAAFNDLTNLWQGKIDLIGIWTKQLSATEISDLYNSGNGNAYREPVATISTRSPSGGAAYGSPMMY